MLEEKKQIKVFIETLIETLLLIEREEKKNEDESSHIR